MNRIFFFGLWLMLAPMGLGQAAEVPQGQPTAIAIWPFESQFAGINGGVDDGLLIREVMADMLGAELGRFGNLRLVERQRLGDLLNEQRLGSSELADEATRLRLGRLIGARWLLFGNHLQIGDAWQFDIRVVDVESSRVVATASESGSGREYGPTLSRLATQLRKALP